MCDVRQQPQEQPRKSHELDILQTSSDRSIDRSCNVRDAGRKGNKIIIIVIYVKYRKLTNSEGKRDVLSM